MNIGIDEEYGVHLSTFAIEPRHLVPSTWHQLTHRYWSHDMLWKWNGCTLRYPNELHQGCSLPEKNGISFILLKPVLRSILNIAKKKKKLIKWARAVPILSNAGLPTVLLWANDFYLNFSVRLNDAYHSHANLKDHRNQVRQTYVSRWGWLPSLRHYQSNCPKLVLHRLLLRTQNTPFIAVTEKVYKPKI